VVVVGWSCDADLNLMTAVCKVYLTELEGGPADSVIGRTDNVELQARHESAMLP